VIAGETTGAGGGLMGLQDKSPGISLLMGLESVNAFGTLEQELGYDIGYNREGGVIPITYEQELKWVEKQVNPLRQMGLDVRFLDRKEIHEIEPVLGDNVFKASYCPLECQVNPIKLAKAYANSARKLGAEIIIGSKVVSVKQGTKGEIIKIITEKGEISADFFVNAAGVWSPEIAQMIGLKIPVLPRKGQIVILGPVMKREIHAIMHGASYFAIRYENDVLSENDLGLAFAVEQRDDFIRLGVTRQFVGFDRIAQKEVSRQIIENAKIIIPDIEKYKIFDSIAGLRPYTPDHKIILGIDDKIPNLVFATGHEGEGTTLAPITGILVSELIFDRKTHLPIVEFSPSRFFSSSR
jgi:sarcosine oxidase subunit beta